MSIERQNIDLVDLARRMLYLLRNEEHKIFGKSLGGSLEQLVDRLLSAGASVDPAVYKLAFMLRDGLGRLR